MVSVAALILACLLALGVLPPAGVVRAQVGKGPTGCPGGVGSPAWLLQRFFDADGFSDRASFYTGEMLTHYRDAPTLGTLLPAEARVEHRPVLVGCSRAVYASTVSTETRGQDWYLHRLWEDGGWRIAAVRVLALPGFFFQLMEMLAADPDTMDHGMAMLGDDAPRLSAAEQLANMRLVASTDAELKAYLEQHRDAFMQLVSAVQRSPSLTFATSDGRARPEGSDAEGIAADLRRLSPNAISRDASHPGCIFVSIGGILDNEVGYLYAPPSCAVPEMSPDLFILIEPISTEWSLFRRREGAEIW